VAPEALGGAAMGTERRGDASQPVRAAAQGGGPRRVRAEFGQRKALRCAGAGGGGGRRTVGRKGEGVVPGGAAAVEHGAGGHARRALRDGEGDLRLCPAKGAVAGFHDTVEKLRILFVADVHIPAGGAGDVFAAHADPDRTARAGNDGEVRARESEPGGGGAGGGLGLETARARERRVGRPREPVRGVTHLLLPACRHVADAAFKITVEVGNGPFVEEISKAPCMRIVEIDVIGGGGGGAAHGGKGQDRADGNRAGRDQGVQTRGPERVEQLTPLAVGHAQRLGPRTGERRLIGLVAHSQGDGLAVEGGVGGIRHGDWKTGAPDVAPAEPERIVPVGRNERGT